MKVLHKCVEAVLLNGIAHVLHQFQVVVQVMHGVEMGGQHFLGAVQMVQVGAAEVLAGVTGAGGIERAFVIFKTGVADANVPMLGKQPTIAGIAGGHDAVKHVDALPHGVDQIFWRAHAHQIAGFVVGQFGGGVGQNALHVVFGFAHRKAANRVTVKTDFRQALQGHVAQIFIHAALHNAKQAVGVAQFVKGVAGPAGPAHGHFHGQTGFVMGGGVRGAFVKNHDNVGIQHGLNTHAFFGGKEEFVPIHWAAKVHALFFNFAHCPQAKHLKPARISQNGAIPAHKLVQTAKIGHDVQAGPHPQVECVAQDDLRIDFAKVTRGHAFDGAIGAYGHENWGLNNPMRRGNLAAPSFAGGGF